MATYSELFSWARIRGMVSARVWFSSLFCSGYKMFLAERGIYVGENPRWRVEATVLICDEDWTSYDCWGSTYDRFVRPVIEGRISPADMVYMYQKEFNEDYFSPCGD